MEEFISLCYRTTCYNCRNDADQVITAVPNVAVVVCENCRATRSFVPVMEDISQTGDYIQAGCYDVWHLLPTAPCRHCGVTGPHDLTIGCRNITVRCRNCSFTHLYRFNLEYIDDSGKITG